MIKGTGLLSPILRAPVSLSKSGVSQKMNNVSHTSGFSVRRASPLFVVRLKVSVFVSGNCLSAFPEFAVCVCIENTLPTEFIYNKIYHWHLYKP